MITRLGQRFSDFFIKVMPSAYVFALGLTLLTGLLALAFTDASPLDISQGWYDGFWSLLAFGMQIILIIVTAFSIAQSTPVAKGIDLIGGYIQTPRQVYFWVVLLGGLLSLISFGMIVVVAILARALALRIPGVNYPFLVACVYFSMNGWVSGISSSIALLLNTPDNFLIEKGILLETISTGLTLGSHLNLAMVLLFLSLGPVLFVWLAPQAQGKEIGDLQKAQGKKEVPSIKEEARAQRLPYPALSDVLNNAAWLQCAVGLLGLGFMAHHFWRWGVDLNFNNIIFIFLMTALLLHKTPLRFGISMQRATRNISGIVFQFPFYAGIMGIMLATGLGERVGDQLSGLATLQSFPFFAYVAGGLVNFAIPSAGGEFAVIGPSILQAVQHLAHAAGASSAETTQYMARAAMAIAYGESLSNLLQPFYLLVVFPIMGLGVRIQARDVVGYLVIPFLLLFSLQSLLVVLVPYG
ncbi:TIGR00366 family protein [Maribacter sp. 2307ULW6-5]|uniref:TIGR00366 family protein n=1 Tax=Maribacter sp. 2307ULW6-5 TaxID=3386275 RepID=UPI0039BCAACF